MIAGWLLAYGVTSIPDVSFIYIIHLNLFGGRETTKALIANRNYEGSKAKDR